ncbi:acetylcholinesterase-1-like [Haemaphysalis longicornis]
MSRRVKGTIHAYRHGPECFQSPANPPRLASEECLTVSVWAPFICRMTDELRPVVVVAASDWFQTGRVADYDAVCRDIAADGDMVVVAISFRLGVFGFLHAPDAQNASTNVGFHDITEALSWIRNHVGVFYGDAHALVALGIGSAGLPLSLPDVAPHRGERYFFKRLILHGMVAGSMVPLNSEQNVRALASRLPSCTKTVKANMTEVVRCLRNVSAPALLEASLGMRMRFVPVLTAGLEGGTESSSPWNKESSRFMENVDVMCGYTLNDARKLVDYKPEDTDAKALFDKLVNFFTARNHTGAYDRKAPWAEFGDSKGVFITNSPDRDVVPNWRSDKCKLVPLLRRFLQHS